MPSSINLYPAFRLLIVFVLFASLSFLSGCAGLDTGGPSVRSLIIKKSALYTGTTAVSEKIREDCEIDERLPPIIQKFADRHYDNIYLMDKVPAGTPAKVLTLKIAEVTAERNRDFLFGRKAVTVEGVLTQYGAVVGSFIDYRVMSERPMTTGYRGTCYLLNRFQKRIGKDIGKWLANPSMNAKLGHARRFGKEMVSSAPGREPAPDLDDDKNEDDEGE